MTEQGTETRDSRDDMVFLRAVRSLAWNRQILPIIQARYNRAEDIVRNRLLVRGEERIYVGPYEISLTEDQDIDLTWNGDDDWRQLHLPDFDPLLDDPLDVRGDELESQSLASNNQQETLDRRIL